MQARLCEMPSILQKGTAIRRQGRTFGNGLLVSIIQKKILASLKTDYVVYLRCAHLVEKDAGNIFHLLIYAPGITRNTQDARDELIYLYT